MTGPMDIIKEYLVSLGFKVDNAQYSKMQQSIKDLSKLVESHTSGMAKDYAKAGGVIASVLASVNLATVGLMEHIAQADLGYQKYAMRMYMARDAAKELKIVTDSMGESLDNIAWIPELRERYFSLMGQARRMEPGQGFEAEMRYLRDIRFEFTRLKVEAVYGLQWIGHNLFRYMGAPIKDIREGLTGMNDWIQQKMPEWTDKVARFLTVFMQLGKDTLRFFKDMAPVLAVIGGYFVATSPLGRAVVVISSLLLLLDDFYAYVDGRKSSKSLAPVWGLLLQIGKELESTYKNLNKIFGGLFDFSSLDGMNTKLRWTVYSLGLIAGGLAMAVNLIVNSLSALKNVATGNLKDAREDLDRSLISDSYIQYLAQIAPFKENQINYAKAPTKNQMWAEAQRVGKMTGIDPLHIYSQWYHESAGFTYAGAVARNNFGGIKGPGGDYRTFGTIDEFGDFYARLMNSPRYQAAGVRGARSLAEFTMALKGAGYFEDSASNYYNGMVRAAQSAPGGMGGSGSTTINMGGVSIPITQPGASPDEIQRRVFLGMEEAYRAAWARQIHEFQGVNP